MKQKEFLTVLLNLGQKSWFWWAVFGVCLGLECGAIYYQEVLEYYPCELCIYVRVWLFAIGLLALAGVALCRWPWPRCILLICQLALTVGLALETKMLLQVEYAWNLSSSCSFVANFPSWAPLDTWWPTMFKVQNLCTPTPLVFWKISMAHGLALVSVGFLAVFGFSLVGEFMSMKRKS